MIPTMRTSIRFYFSSIEKYQRALISRDMFPTMMTSIRFYSSSIGKYQRALISRDMFPTMRTSIRFYSSSIGKYQRNDHSYFVELLEKKITLVESKSVNTHISVGRIHCSVLKHGLRSDQLCGKLIRLYGAFGCTVEVEKFFKECCYANEAGLATWNATIAALAIGGMEDSERAMQMFLGVPRTLVKTEATHWHALVACSHAGMPSWGNYVLGKIYKTLCKEPAIEHLGTYIDALARSGCLEEATKEVKCSVYTPNREMIVSILNRCPVEAMNEIGLAKDFVAYLEKRGITYRLHKSLYRELLGAGVEWGNNVKILRQRRVGESIALHGN